ncbi:hypothetical protein [Aeromonas media]|uniref:hypothetical protein n=1 Tax=Aeromonas media TaxID=651 RepID=UPI003D209666
MSFNCKSWFMVLIDKEMSVVRVFSASPNFDSILKTAINTLTTAERENPAFYREIGNRKLELKNGKKATGEQECRDTLRNVYLLNLNDYLETHQSQRYQYETALYLMGIDPLANYLPFSENYLPPNPYQTVNIIRAYKSILRHAKIDDFANNELSISRISDFTRMLKEHLSSLYISQKHRDEINSFFDVNL